uniref:Uncharacterized protein n=1 Tax=Strigamia maritima TaxID=126957 RepID=T1IJZ5_STRMM
MAATVIRVRRLFRITAKGRGHNSRAAVIRGRPLIDKIRMNATIYSEECIFYPNGSIEYRNSTSDDYLNESTILEITTRHLKIPVFHYDVKPMLCHMFCLSTIYVTEVVYTVFSTKNAAEWQIIAVEAFQIGSEISTLTWLNVITFDMWNQFRPKLRIGMNIWIISGFSFLCGLIGHCLHAIMALQGFFLYVHACNDGVHGICIMQIIKSVKMALVISQLPSFSERIDDNHDDNL